LTARTGHWRSSELESVDKALLAYERNRSPNNLTALQTAFQKWHTHKKGEVTERNKESCIYRLALNLGLAAELLKSA